MTISQIQFMATPRLHQILPMSKGLQISDYKVALHLHTTENIGRRIVDPMSFNVCLASPITAYIVKFSKDASQSKIRTGFEFQRSTFCTQ
jgi:mannitol-specific phosphotransferase system IIBC component